MGLTSTARVRPVSLPVTGQGWPGSCCNVSQITHKQHTNTKSLFGALLVVAEGLIPVYGSFEL